MVYPNFRAGLQMSDNGGSSQLGDVLYTDYADVQSYSESGWAMDSNNTDPDAARIYLEVEQIDDLTGLDFRLGVVASDNGATSQKGIEQFTKWASEGSSWSGWASDLNGYDPDAYQLILETRTWNSSKVLEDFRLGIQLSDNNNSNTGATQFTPWARDGGGRSDWAGDSNYYDPDSMQIYLGVSFKTDNSSGNGSKGDDSTGDDSTGIVGIKPTPPFIPIYPLDLR